MPDEQDTARSETQVPWRTGVVLLVVLAVVIVVAIIARDKEDIYSYVDRLRPQLIGDNSAQVVQKLGEPSYQLDEGRTWHYSDHAELDARAGAGFAGTGWHILEIQFDDVGRVSRVTLTD